MNNPFGATITNNQINADTLYKCLRAGHVAAAVLAVGALTQVTAADVFFNIAMTHHLTGDNARAIENIDLALAALKRVSPMPKQMPRPMNFNAARAIDIANKSYMNPINAEYISDFPDLAMGDFLMTGVTIARAANLTAKMANYLAVLIGPEYEIFKKEVQ